jgi:glycine dehydrogenase subunit 1
MPFLPHTESDVQAMLKAIGVDSIEQLFDEIPPQLIVKRLEHVPETANEMEVARLMKMRAARDTVELCFAGAGAYEHHIPAAVWQIVGRGEFYSAYTPYQAEASQGTLQLIYEYQTMMTRLTGTDISNASMYDGATAMAEAVLMAERSRKKGGARRVLVPESLHPAWRRTLTAIVDLQKIEVVTLPCPDGRPGPGARLRLRRRVHRAGDPAAELLRRARGSGRAHRRRAGARRAGDRRGQPDVAGAAEGARALGRARRRHRLRRRPAARRADVLGRTLLRLPRLQEGNRAQHAGRIVGRTTDLDGKTGYTLTLQAREQHIRRAKATSNICTNQGLLVPPPPSTWRSPDRRDCAASPPPRPRTWRRCAPAWKRSPACACASRKRSHFHEAAFELPVAAQPVIEQLAGARILAGVCPGADYAGMEKVLLLCTTETKSAADLESFANALEAALA